jgi:DNA-binding CsgD family transcriptional regulator
MLGWVDIVQNYIAKYSNQIRKTTQPLRDHFGIRYFTYHRVDNAGKYTVLVDRPDWAEHYVSEQIFRQDPYLRHPSVYQSGICLIDSHGSNQYKEVITKAGKEVLKMDLGAMFIQKHASCVEFFGFAAHKESSSLQDLYLNHPRLLKSFGAYFKKELAPILTQMEQEAGSLIDLKGEDFFHDQLIYPDRSVVTRLAYYRDLGMTQELKAFEKLSKRERQCLRLLIENKSAKETALTLGLSRRTVESYFESIKHKLSCWSKRDVLDIAKRCEEMGLLP